MFDVLLSIRERGINSAAARAAGAYVETRLQPIKDEMERQVEGIPVVIAVLLFFLVILPLLIYLIWIAYELDVSAGVALAVVLIFFVVVAVAIYFIVTTISDAIDTVIETATRQFISLDNPQALSAFLASLNNASRNYLTVIGETCIL